MKKYLTLLIITVFFSFIIVFGHPLYLSGQYKKYNNLKLSVQDITLTSPINKTYSEPMNGYYPATYGFENEISGTKPSGWTTTGNAGDPLVIDSLGTHNKVVELADLISIQERGMYQDFISQSSGTVEWWFRSSDSNDHTNFNFYNSGTQAIYTSIGDGYFQHFTSSWTNIIPCSSNLWYHLRVDFDINVGIKGQYNLTIDGIQEVTNQEFINSVPGGINRVSTATSTLDVGYISYIDAIGYSWDPNYNIGDNLQEGLLLSFLSGTTLLWEGYTLDGNLNKTIVGDSTIPMPDYGVHNIQVFGNDTFSTIHLSDIVYFTYAIFRLDSPENMTYTIPMNGYYPGTYGFENEEDGTSGTDIRFVDDVSGSEANSYITVQAEEDGHKKVLEFYDNNGAGNAVFYGNLVSGQTSGTVEFYIKTTDATLGFNLNMADVGTGNFYFGIALDYFMWHNGVTWQNIIGITDNTWYHIRIDFECGTGGYSGLAADMMRVYINNVLHGDFAFTATADAIDVVSGLTYTVDNAYYVYMDAIGYSWDPNYNIGDNLDEGLLLSFDNDTVLDWIGYSLNGQVNKTILGNVTIPLPVNGLHTIQVFGDPLIGSVLETELIFFTINTLSETVPISPTTLFDITVVILTSIIIIGVVGSLSLGFIYLKKFRHKGLKIKSKDTIKDQEKKRKAQVLLERERLKKELIESERLERERLERERLIRQENLAREEERKTLEKLKKIMSVSSRISMEMVREYIKIDKLTFNEKVIDWASQFGFTIDGEYLNIRKENVSDFIDELEKQFSQWRRDEQGRESKM